MLNATWLRRLLVIALTAGAGSISYPQLHDLAAAHGMGAREAWTFPLCVDLAAITAARAWWSRRDLYSGALALVWAAGTIVGNAALAYPDPWGVVIHAIPGLTLVTSAHLLFRTERELPSTSTRQRSTQTTDADPAPGQRRRMARLRRVA